MEIKYEVEPCSTHLSLIYFSGGGRNLGPGAVGLTTHTDVETMPRENKRAEVKVRNAWSKFVICFSCARWAPGIGEKQALIQSYEHSSRNRQQGEHKLTETGRI